MSAEINSINASTLPSISYTSADNAGSYYYGFSMLYPNKTEQAFRAARGLVDKGLVKVKTPLEFIQLVEELISCL